MKKGRNSGEQQDSDAVWQRVTRSIKAYPASKNVPGKGGTVSAKRPLEKPPVPPRAGLRFSPVPAVRATGKGFDRSTETKLKKGRLALEGRLDLHGLTQEEAFAALHRFIRRAAAEEKRTVLVITGKGGVQSGGVLRRMLPLWLEDSELKKYILAIAAASPKDGGTGAFYIRLRKPRNI